MLRIYLTRHGQDRDNANGILNGRRNEPLTKKGIQQAKEVARKIRQKGMRFDKVYSSPLQRTYKTAKIISDILKLQEPEIIEELIERDLGIMTGLPIAKIEEMCSPNILKTTTVTYFLTAKGAETFPQLIKRADKLLHRLQMKHKDSTILLVTHGDVGKMLYAAYYNIDWSDVLKMFHFGNSELLELSKESKAEDTHVFKIPQHNA